MAHIPRIHVPALDPAAPLRLEGDAARRLTSVMRLRPGDGFLVFDSGREWEAAVTASSRGHIEASIGPLVREEGPLPPAIELWCALVRPQRFDWMIEKATEAGVGRIVPCTSEHTARGESPSTQRQERWERIAVEAAEQSGRLTVPSISDPRAIGDLAGADGEAVLVCHPGGEPIIAACHALAGVRSLAIAIGPEGGFSDTEIAGLTGAGARLVSLGPGILRTETAAVAATAIVRAAFDAQRPAT